MKNGYEFNCATNTLTITKAFQKKASDINSQEYITIGLYRADNPYLRIVVKDTPKRKQKKLPYEKMAKYILCQENSDVLFKKFLDVKERARAQGNPYLYTEKWFLSVFPDYDKIPDFDRNGNIIRPEPKAAALMEQITEGAQSNTAA